MQNEWREICSQSDIDKLLEEYRDFHDACLVSANYHSGASVNGNGAMSFGSPHDYNLIVVFQSQWEPKVLEMRFVGVRQCHITGWQNNRDSCISEAYLGLHEKLLPDKSDRVIVWSDNSWFDVNRAITSIQEPSDTYVVANSMLWRIHENLSRAEAYENRNLEY